MISVDVPRRTSEIWIQIDYCAGACVRVACESALLFSEGPSRVRAAPLKPREETRELRLLVIGRASVSCLRGGRPPPSHSFVLTPGPHWWVYTSGRRAGGGGIKRLRSQTHDLDLGSHWKCQEVQLGHAGCWRHTLSGLDWEAGGSAGAWCAPLPPTPPTTTTNPPPISLPSDRREY